MPKSEIEDWLDVLERTEYEPDEDAPRTYQSYRLKITTICW
jgi:hypothetical protein